MPTNGDDAGGGRITHELIASPGPDVARRHAFISGPLALANLIRVALRGLGAGRVHTDYCSGY